MRFKRPGVSEGTWEEILRCPVGGNRMRTSTGVSEDC